MRLEQVVRLNCPSSDVLLLAIISVTSKVGSSTWTVFPERLRTAPPVYVQLARFGVTVPP